MFLDEDGIPIVFTSNLPQGTKLFLQKNESPTDQIISKIQEETKNNLTSDFKTISWSWKEPENSSHKRKNNNLTVYQPQNETISHCFGDLVMTQGKIYYTLLIDPMMCCVYIGIEETGKNLEKKSSEFLNQINFFKLFEGNATQIKPAIEAGFLIDMESKSLTITDHEKNIVKKEFFFNSTWKRVSPLVYFKHVISITISNCSLPIPSWI